MTPVCFLIMSPKTFFINQIPIEIVDNTIIIDIFGPNMFSDIKAELFKGCGVLTRTVHKPELEILLDRYKEYNLKSIYYIILADLELVHNLTQEQLTACLYHEIGHIEKGHLLKDTDEYSLEEELEADNYAIEKGIDKEVLISALTTIIHNTLSIRHRNKVVTNNDILCYRGYTARKSNIENHH